MENYSSCEKLVAIEAGLIPPQRINNLPLFTKVRRERNPQQCMKYAYILLASMLFGVVSYEVWQTVRHNRFINEIETKDVESFERHLPLIPADPRIKDIAKKLERVLQESEEMENSDQEDVVPVTTEIPETGNNRMNVHQNTDADLLLPEASNTLEVLPPFSEFKQEQYPIFPFINEDAIPDIDNRKSSMQEVEVDEPEPGFHDPSEVSDVTESPETKETGLEQTDSTLWRYWSDHYLLTPTIMPASDVIGNSWEWTFPTEESSESSETEEEVEEKTDNVEIQGFKTLLDEDYPFDDRFFYEESFMPDEYISWLEGDLGSEDFEKLHEPAIDGVPASLPSTPTLSMSTFSSDYSSQSPEFSAIRISEDIENESTPIEGVLEKSLTQDYQQPNFEQVVEKYFQDLIKQRISEIQFLEQIYVEMEDDGGDVDTAKNIESDPEELPVILENSDMGDQRYIIKRSVDQPEALARPGIFLTPKELAQKMILLQQAIDDDNHLLQNEVSLTSGPTKEILQAKLDKFYTKMEVVSAHIDRLHERYMRFKKLDDDYVSREFPNEDMDGNWAPNN